MHAHLCGRLPRDTLVVGYDPGVPVFMLSGEVSTWFRCASRRGRMRRMRMRCGRVKAPAKRPREGASAHVQRSHACGAAWLGPWACTLRHDRPVQHAGLAERDLTLPILDQCCCRPLGALLDNVAQGYCYNCVSWQVRVVLLLRSRRLPCATADAISVLMPHGRMGAAARRGRTCRDKQRTY